MADYLYIHIPFCVRKCIYCDFLSFRHDPDLAGTYMDVLCRELVLKKESAGKLKTIYIGGGTPTLLSGDCFEQLFSCLWENYIYAPDIEITIEANPGTITRSGISKLRSLGVNRISIGIQSFNDNELNVLGRVHNSEEALGSIEIIRKSGIENLSLDLMYGIPGQTIDSWHKTLTVAAGLSPSHVSAYELTPESGTPLSGLLISGQMILPQEEAILDMLDLSLDHLSVQGFEHYEISNFARPGFRCVHNINYWDRGDYIGAGLGAHYNLNGFRSSNTGDIKTYIRQLGLGIMPVAESTQITDKERIREFIFLGLRKTGGISIATAMAHGINLTSACAELAGEGFIEIKGDSIRLTQKGLRISNTVIVRIFELTGL